MKASSAAAIAGGNAAAGGGPAWPLQLPSPRTDGGSPLPSPFQPLPEEEFLAPPPPPKRRRGGGGVVPLPAPTAPAGTAAAAMAGPQAAAAAAQAAERVIPPLAPPAAAAAAAAPRRRDTRPSMLGVTVSEGLDINKPWGFCGCGKRSALQYEETPRIPSQNRQGTWCVHRVMAVPDCASHASLLFFSTWSLQLSAAKTPEKRGFLSCSSYCIPFLPGRRATLSSQDEESQALREG